MVSVLFGIGLGWGLYGNTSSPLDFTSDPGAKPDGVAAVVLTPPKQLQSLGGMTGLLEQARKKFGDTIGYRLLVYPTYASFYRPDPSDDRRVLDYDYRGGWDDPTAPGTLTLSVYVSGEYGSGSIDFAGDGTPKRVNYPSN